MKLLIKQRVFSWRDSYDIYDEQGNEKYRVKAEAFSLGHQLKVFDKNECQIGTIQQRLITLLPIFDIELNGTHIGTIQKQFSLLTPKYSIDFNGWQVSGDFMGWDYDVISEDNVIVHISKELLHWGDTYVLDFVHPEDEVMGMILVIAIDAANRSK